MSRLFTIQKTITERLRSRDSLRGLAVIAETATPAGKASAAVARAAGPGIVVLPLSPEAADSGTPPTFGTVAVTVRVTAPLAGRPEGTEEAVTRALQGWTPPVAGVSEALALRAESPWTRGPDDAPAGSTDRDIYLHFELPVTL